MGEILVVGIGILIALKINTWKKNELGQGLQKIDSEKVIKLFVQKPEFESYLVRDLGRAFRTSARLKIGVIRLKHSSDIYLFLLI